MYTSHISIHMRKWSEVEEQEAVGVAGEEGGMRRVHTYTILYVGSELVGEGEGEERGKVWVMDLNNYDWRKEWRKDMEENEVD